MCERRRLSHREGELRTVRPMPTVRQVEARIEQVEGFRVRFLHPDGRDVRGDHGNVPQYGYKRAAVGSSTVREWKDVRFAPNYSGWEVEVLDGGGDDVPRPESSLDGSRDIRQDVTLHSTRGA